MLKLEPYVKALGNLAFPASCPACYRQLAFSALDEHICSACREHLPLNTPPYCSLCGCSAATHFLKDGRCLECKNGKYHFDRAYAPFVYRGSIKTIINNFKFFGHIHLSKSLAGLTAKNLDNFSDFSETDLIVPVPTHWMNTLLRPYDPVKELAREIARLRRKPCIALIRKKRRMRHQRQLKKSERLDNPRDAFAVAPASKYKHKNALIVDDVFTTGSTVNECAKLLKKAGFNKVRILTVARGG